MMKTRQLYALLIAALMLVVPQVMWAQADYFTFDDNEPTIITGLTPAGLVAPVLTIPATVTTVAAEAFDYPSLACSNLIIAGGNPIFKSGSLGTKAQGQITYLDMGNGMSVANMRTLLEMFGSANALQEIIISGYHDGSIDWSDDTMKGILTGYVDVKMPAALVSDQVFGNAQLYGRFTINGELATTCVNASFVDVDDGSNFLFYIPTSVEDGNRIKIQRVKYITGREGVMIHNTTGTAVNADLLLDDGTHTERRTKDNVTYQSNMLVGVTTATYIYETATKEGTQYTNLILYQGAFHPTDGGTIPANRAYLQIKTSDWETMNVRQLTFNFDDIETGIDVVTEGTNDKDIYDLTGRKVSMPRKGVYIKNGRKTFIK